MVNFYELLREENGMKNMPNVTISRRITDKTIVFNPKLMRLDRIAGDVYGDETLYKLLMWANPEIMYEFDIPRGAIIRIPFPLNDVLQEVVAKIQLNKNR
jgi:hypothetical protein